MKITEHRCKKCGRLHNLFYCEATNDTTHLGYYCEFTKATIMVPFQKGLPIPWKKTVRLQKLENKAAREASQPS